MLLEKIGLPENFMPTSLAFDNSCHLWMITGAAEVVRPDSMNAAESEAKGSVVATSAITCVRVIGLSHAGSDNLLKSTVLDDSAVPGGDKLLKTLQGDHAPVAITRDHGASVVCDADGIMDLYLSCYVIVTGRNTS